jgi:hypothetical protein
MAEAKLHHALPMPALQLLVTVAETLCLLIPLEDVGHPGTFFLRALMGFILSVWNIAWMRWSFKQITDITAFQNPAPEAICIVMERDGKNVDIVTRAAAHFGTFSPFMTLWPLPVWRFLFPLMMIPCIRVGLVGLGYGYIIGVYAHWSPSVQECSGLFTHSVIVRLSHYHEGNPTALMLMAVVFMSLTSIVIALLF